MRSLIVVLIGAVGIAIAYTLFGKKAGIVACVPANVSGPLLPNQQRCNSGPTVSGQQSPGNSNAQIFSADQKVANNQPDITPPIKNFIPPPPPPDIIIGSPGGIAGVPSAISYPQPQPPAPPADGTVLPNNVFNPPPAPAIDIIGTPGGFAGTPSGVTYPAPVPPPPGGDGSLPTGTSPYFWAADKVPVNQNIPGSDADPNLTVPWFQL